MNKNSNDDLGKYYTGGLTLLQLMGVFILIGTAAKLILNLFF